MLNALLVLVKVLVRKLVGPEVMRELNFLCRVISCVVLFIELHVHRLSKFYEM